MNDTSPEQRNLPIRVVVGANGAYWRDYGDAYSMCPVSRDNDPVVPVAIYVPAAGLRVALHEALGEGSEETGLEHWHSASGGRTSTGDRPGVYVDRQQVHDLIDRLLR